MNLRTSGPFFWRNRTLLGGLLETTERRFDDSAAMLAEPPPNLGYHSRIKRGCVHPTRETLQYALLALEMGGRARVDRAQRAIRSVLALQDAARKSPTFGIWPWYAEEPIAKMRPPDHNWADFLGATLLDIRQAHASCFRDDLLALIDSAIKRAATAICGRDVGAAYTNIAIMGSLVVLRAGELYDVNEWKAYGRNKLAQVGTRTRENGGFDEFNSPTYTSVAICEIERARQSFVSSSAVPELDFLHERAWAELARHYHPPTRMWAGPHSRCYATHPAERRWLSIIDRGIGSSPEKIWLEDFHLNLECPHSLRGLFRDLDGARTEIVATDEVSGGHGGAVSYLCPSFALGSVASGDLWGQRRALLGYWGTPDSAGSLRLRCLKDGQDFASARLTSSQHEGGIAGAITFSATGGDRHLVLDLRQDGTAVFGDLRICFELCGTAADAEVKKCESGFVVRDGGMRIRITGRGRWNGAESRQNVRRQGDSLSLEWILWSGPETKWDFNWLVAAFGFTLEFLAPEEKAAVAEINHHWAGVCARLGELIAKAEAAPSPVTITPFMRAAGGSYVRFPPAS